MPLSRRSDEDAVLPLSSPVRGLDGQLIYELPVPAGTIVWVNVLGLNRDPAIWGPDAAEWKPERWLSPLPGTVTDAHVPSVFANLYVAQSYLGFAAYVRSVLR